MREVTILLLVTTAALAQDQISDESLGKAKRLTVMINATIDGKTQPGAGIIFGLTADRVYIATVNHLVRRAASEASMIQVEFNWLPGTQFMAQLLTKYDPALALDLAVLTVSGVPNTGADRAGLAWDRLGEPSGLVQGARAALVWAIGYPDGSAYEVSPGQISKVETNSIKYRVPGLVPGGYSGGPLVDYSGLVLGMIKQDQPPDTEVTRIDRIVSRLKDWSYPVALVAPSPNTSALRLAERDLARRQQGRAANPFRDVLLSYISNAPEGFVALGGRRTVGWTPTINLPDSSCQGTIDPAIVCVASTEKDLTAAEPKFEEISTKVHASLIGWTKKELPRGSDLRRVRFTSGLHPKTRVDVGLVPTMTGSEYNIYIEVGAINP